MRDALDVGTVKRMEGVRIRADEDQVSQAKETEQVAQVAQQRPRRLELQSCQCLARDAQQGSDAHRREVVMAGPEAFQRQGAQKGTDMWPAAPTEDLDLRNGPTRESALFVRGHTDVVPQLVAPNEIRPTRTDERKPAVPAKESDNGQRPSGDRCTWS